MKTSLHPGLVLELSYRVTDERPPWMPPGRSEPSRPAPASDTMVGLMRWACMEAMRSHVEAGEHSVGLETEILRAEEMAPGLVAHVEVLVERVEGRKIWFRVKAYDGARPVGEGTHERFVMDRERLSPRPARAAAPPARPRPRARASRQRRRPTAIVRLRVYSLSTRLPGVRAFQRSARPQTAISTARKRLVAAAKESAGRLSRARIGLAPNGSSLTR